MKEYHVSFVLKTGKGIRKDWLLFASDKDDAIEQIVFSHNLDNQQVYIVSAEPYRKEPLLNKR
jgi:hypothetical protein